MEEQRVKAGAGPIPSAHLGFVDAAKGLGILAVIWVKSRGLGILMLLCVVLVLQAGGVLCGGGPAEGAPL